MRFNRNLQAYGVLLSLVIGAMAVAGCGASNAGDSQRTAAAGFPGFDLGPDGRTDKPAQVAALAGSGYIVEPLITVGDEIPFYEGTFPALNVNQKLSYALPGICDGLGVHKHGEHYWVWMNSEIRPGSKSNYSTTVSGQIDGARVSLLLFNKDFEVLGGRNLVERIYDGTTLIGEVKVDTKTKAVTQTGTVLNRFCSSTLASLYGNKPLYFTGEETANGRAFAIDVNGNARLVRDAVRFAYENIVPVSKYSGETVALLLDDTGSSSTPANNRPFGAYLALYVGDTSQGNYGFNAGTSYVGQVWVGGAPVASSGAVPFGGSATLKWIEVPKTYDFGSGAVSLYTNSNIFYRWANTVAGATGFQRPEDGHEDPSNPGQLSFDTTGSIGSYDPYGRIWQLDLGATPLADATLHFHSAGSPSTYMNPDNLTVDSFGDLWLQEDPSGTQALMLAAGRTATIFRGKVGSTAYTAMFQVNQNDGPFSGYAIPDFAANPWETSGIVQVPGADFSGEPTLLFDTQAHGWTAAADIGWHGLDYVEGGQLLLAYPDGAPLL